ncbi:hypothetical protein DFH07DRAFT_974059 [Mycena maculata]|uniref:Uncharacterized protein n=1 Tax=Mycena maculata TaxID=230809 RepID=A0AAD7H9S9_9AGAR|nr:hypothetical protein DFH07DRAFT_974059 [Mycena maculata]
MPSANDIMWLPRLSAPPSPSPSGAVDPLVPRVSPLTLLSHSSTSMSARRFYPPASDATSRTGGKDGRGGHGQTPVLADRGRWITRDPALKSPACPSFDFLQSQAPFTRWPPAPSSSLVVEKRSPAHMRFQKSNPTFICQRPPTLPRSYEGFPTGPSAPLPHVGDAPSPAPASSAPPRPVVAISKCIHPANRPLSLPCRLQRVGKMARLQRRPRLRRTPRASAPLRLVDASNVSFFDKPVAPQASARHRNAIVGTIEYKGSGLIEYVLSLSSSSFPLAIPLFGRCSLLLFRRRMLTAFLNPVQRALTLLLPANDAYRDGQMIHYLLDSSGRCGRCRNVNDTLASLPSRYSSFPILFRALPARELYSNPLFPRWSPAPSWSSPTRRVALCPFAISVLIFFATFASQIHHSRHTVTIVLFLTPFHYAHSPPFVFALTILSFHAKS